MKNTIKTFILFIMMTTTLVVLVFGIISVVELVFDWLDTRKFGEVLFVPPQFCIYEINGNEINVKEAAQRVLNRELVSVKCFVEPNTLFESLVK